MKNIDDEDLEFDDDLPELDLSDLDLEEEKEDSSKKYQLKKYESDPDESEEFAALIKQEAFKALDIPEEQNKVPSTIPLDEEEPDAEFFDYTEEDFGEEKETKIKGGGVAVKILLGIVVAVMVCAALLVLTEPGRNILYKIAGSWARDNMGTDDSLYTDASEEYPSGVDNDKRNQPATIIPLEDPSPTEIAEDNSNTVKSKYRSEDYVKTYLLFGIEEIGGAANTDAILLLSVNTKDNSIKLTSIMRDTYVQIPGFYSNKINSAYASGMRTGDTIEEKKMNGAHLLMQTIEENFDIEITGFMCVNFKSFEKIIDRLGGIDIELGSSEASYLRTTNYISNPAYRTVVTGWNHMNGNQVLGYCRVRKRPTLGGADADYGRTLRHRRVVNAVIQQYKSLPLGDMYAALKDCLAYVISDLTEEQLSTMLKDIVENKTFTLAQFRIPVDGKFKDSGKKGIFNGKYNVTYALTLDKYLDENIKLFHEFVFLDGQEEVADEGQTASTSAGELTPVATPSASPAA